MYQLPKNYLKNINYFILFILFVFARFLEMFANLCRQLNPWRSYNSSRTLDDFFVVTESSCSRHSCAPFDEHIVGQFVLKHVLVVQKEQFSAQLFLSVLEISPVNFRVGVGVSSWYVWRQRGQETFDRAWFIGSCLCFYRCFWWMMWYLKMIYKNWKIQI